MPKKMFKEKDQPLEMRGLELAVDAVERVGDRVADARFLQITLEIENVLASGRDFRMLGLGYSPDEQMKFTLILGKISRNFFADEGVL